VSIHVPIYIKYSIEFIDDSKYLAVCEEILLVVLGLSGSSTVSISSSTSWIDNVPRPSGFSKRLFDNGSCAFRVSPETKNADVHLMTGPNSPMK
jgi:hypothetical protein